MLFDPASSFRQSPPRLANQFDDDRVLASYLARTLPPEVLRDIEPELRDLGELAAGELFELQRQDRGKEPELTSWSPWGERIDHVELTPLWHRAAELAAQRGIVAAAYERRHGPWSRIHQLALAYLFSPSVDVYGCPLAMTDGAARTLEVSGNRELLSHAFPRLISRDPRQAWTSGQWMTESIGGSDVSRSETVARLEDDGLGGRTWRLYGRKWFTSAVTSQMALTLARPEGAGLDRQGPGSHGLALFYVETRDAEGRPNHLRVARLKDKLGTRKLPTAELILDGVPAIPVQGLEDGVRRIAPMLNVTRTWNALTAVALMRRGIALARDYARRREVFGSSLAEKPLHRDTLAGLQAEMEGAFHLTFRLAELLGRQETGEASGDELRLLRILTPLAKLTTAKQAVAVSSEVLEAFGGAGYVEDTGLPSLLRDAQVLPIWEGTTNVLALDALQLPPGSTELLRAEAQRCLRDIRDPTLLDAANTAYRSVVHAEAWLTKTSRDSPEALEAGARRYALTLGRSLELAYLCRQAQGSLDQEKDPRPAAAARRLRAHGVDRIREELPPEDAGLLGNDTIDGTPTVVR